MTAAPTTDRRAPSPTDVAAMQRPTPALSYAQLLADAATRVRELMPWDLATLVASAEPPLIVDVREPQEFASGHLRGAINVPRGVLEGACDWGYDDTVPELAGSRARAIVVVCRSGNRSLLAADVMQRMGYADVRSLKLGVRGWNDDDRELVDGAGAAVDGDRAEDVLRARVRPDQMRPAEA
jgi:rhodanese-related sulfurtransferase